MCEGVKKVSINGDIFSFFLFIFICGDKKIIKTSSKFAILVLKTKKSKNEDKIAFCN
jgi:hypothetical protein